MRVKNITQRFEAFVQNLQESFWDDFQGQTRQRLKEVLGEGCRAADDRIREEFADGDHRWLSGAGALRVSPRTLWAGPVPRSPGMAAPTVDIRW
jgi:hypothetical protein